MFPPHTTSGIYESEPQAAAKGRGVTAKHYLPLRQASEAGHGGEAAEDPVEFGVLRNLQERGRWREDKSAEQQ